MNLDQLSLQYNYLKSTSSDPIVVRIWIKIEAKTNSEHMKAKRNIEKKHPRKAHCHLPTNDANNSLWVTHTCSNSQWSYSDCSSKYDMCMHVVISSEKRTQSATKLPQRLDKLFSFIHYSVVLSFRHLHWTTESEGLSF